MADTIVFDYRAILALGNKLFELYTSVLEAGKLFNGKDIEPDATKLFNQLVRDRLTAVRRDLAALAESVPEKGNMFHITRGY
jgi:hypothetical protein